MNKKKICIITGSNGYLGSYLEKFFKKKNWKVYGTTSNKALLHKKKLIFFDLASQSFEKTNLLKNCDLLIHCAYDLNTRNINESNKVNYQGSKFLFSLAKKNNVKKIINISTLSSFIGAKSIYGKTKFLIEKFAIKNNITTIKPGLLYGYKSRMFDKIKKIALSSPIIPIIGNGKFKIHLSHYQDLSNLIYKISLSKSNKVKIFYAATKEYIYFIDLIKHFSPNNLCIKIPLFYFKILLHISNSLKLTKFNIDNLEGLINYNNNMQFNKFNNFDIKFRGIKL